MARTFYNPYEKDPVGVDATDSSDKVIKSFTLDLSDLPQSTTTRSFAIAGDNGASFTLEINNEDSPKKYYNFTTNTFTATKSKLEASIENGQYRGFITFPTVADDDHYDIYLRANIGTKHVPYNEVRFGDGTLDINSSTGSNSSLVQKIIYQYTPVTLTLTGYSVGGTVAGTFGTSAIEMDRGKSFAKTAFSFTTTAGATAAYRILKQPTVDDILSFVQPVVSSSPETIPGENIYPTVTNTDTTGGVISSTDLVTMTTDVEDKMVPGDRVTGTGISSSDVVTVLNITDGTAKQFRASQSVSIGGGVTLSFSNQKNYQWPVDNVNKIKPGMIIVPGTSVTADSVVGNYKETTTVLANTEKEKTYINKKVPAINTKNQKPTLVDGLVTVQPGNLTFDKQQVKALAGTTLKIGGYGSTHIENIHGYDIKFTDLAITLTAPTTTTTAVSTSSTTVTVADREGVINNVSRVGGIGIDPSVQNPLITSGGGADGAGTWTVDAAQTLENGITLTVENTGRIATISGNIEVVKAGTADATLRFDVNNLLSTSA